MKENSVIHFFKGFLPSPGASLRKLILHDTFRAGITLKGIDGILESIGGVLLYFFGPSAINNVAQFLFDHDLPLDPHDFVASHLLRVSENLMNGGRIFASFYLVSHGIVKIVLVTALWFDRLWAYPLTIFVFGLFSMYQLYRFSHTHSLALLLFTIFDVLIICLTWREYLIQKRIRQ